ncbi:MAG: pitrilysin family protein [Candidatus Velthaea sp.]|jgi:zinc protease
MIAGTTPPAPSAPRSATLPTPSERTLPNGLRVIAFAQRSGPKALGVPLIAAQLIVRGGGASETDAQAGLCALTASLLTTGTIHASALEIAEQVDALGARLDANSGYDASVVSVSATTPVFRDAFAIFRDLQRPAFAAAEVERVRTKSIGDLGLTYSNPSSLARLVASRVAYGASPYGHPLAGTAETLATLTRDKIAAFHRRWYRPDNAVLVIGGDIVAEDAFELVEEVFGDWTAPSEALSLHVSQPAAPPVARVLVIDKPDAGRTAIIAGSVAIARSSPQYYAGTVATAVLSGYSGRLNQEIRVKRGLSYGAGAQLVTRRDPGMFVASTLVDHSKVVEAVGVVRATLAGLAQAPVDPAELAPRKETVLGSFYRGIETLDGIAGTLGELALYDVPLADLDGYAARIAAVTPADVQGFAAAHIDADPFLVLVGNAGIFGEAIRAAHPDAIVIRSDRLDLNAANLLAAND